MNKMSPVKRASINAICMALCYVLTLEKPKMIPSRYAKES